jgi:hypothetical protein
MFLSSISEKLLTFFRLKQTTGGLEITDQVMRLGVFEGLAWQFYAVRMEPGILEGSKIKDREKFLEYLAALRRKVLGAADAKKKIHVTVALGETAMFNQIFSLPLVKGENLESAAQLNLQMSSPADFSQVYSGWQVVKRDESLSRMELLGAFADRALVDGLVAALFDAGFVAIAVESKALALARLLREEGRGLDIAAPYIVVGIDDAGLDFLIIRNGQLYFEYANVWRDIADGKGTISAEKFQEALERSLRQVMNFYLQHWEGRIAGVVVSAAVFLDEVQRAAEETLSLPVISLATMLDGKITPEWFVAFGTGLRSLYGRGKDHEITLLGVGARETYEKDRVLGFVAFWRIFVPAMFGVLVILFCLADFFMGRVSADLPPSASGRGISPSAQEIASLRSQADIFNRSVALVALLENGQVPKSAIINDIAADASANNVTIMRLSYPSPGSPLFLAGTAPSEAQILAFKVAMVAEPQFESVSLPLSGIQNSGGAYAFSMTFRVKE